MKPLFQTPDLNRKGNFWHQETREIGDSYVNITIIN